jgi:phosphopantothenoylcysteine decarboxylase
MIVDNKLPVDPFMTTAPSVHILLGVTGSVAAVKAPELAVRLSKLGTVKVLLTRGGGNFWSKAATYNPQAYQECTAASNNNTIHIITADEEWQSWNELGDSVLHIDLRNWADVLVLAPLSAHTLAKLCCGLCDDTLSCVVRAWEFGRADRPAKPFVVAPAMNTAMWVHPLTTQQLDVLRSFFLVDSNSFRVVPPQSKVLACGEVGDGALAELATIVEAVLEVTSKR